MKNKMVKIIDKRENKRRKFKDLEVGTIFFTTENNKALCIKPYGEVSQAVSLEDGSILIFKNNEYVIPVDIEINIIK